MVAAGAVKPSQILYSSNDAFAIPIVEDSLNLLVRARYFSKLYLRNSYWQVSR